MPIVNIEPKSSVIADKLLEKIGKIRKTLRSTICEISGFPETDVIINLCTCPFLNADPIAADVVIYLETNPHEDLENKADSLCRKIAEDLIDLGLTINVGLTAEVWPRFVPGSWCLVEDGKIVDFVSHSNKRDISALYSERNTQGSVDIQTGDADISV